MRGVHVLGLGVVGLLVQLGLSSLGCGNDFLSSFLLGSNSLSYIVIFGDNCTRS